MKMMKTALMPEDLLEQKEFIEDYLKNGQHVLSTFSFVSLFIWKEFFKFRLEIIDGNLCLFAGNALGWFLYLPPLGKKIFPSTIEKCFQMMESENLGSGVSRIENVSLAHLHLFPEGKYDRYKKAYEYCYFKKDIINLKGKPFKSQRSSYNQFTRNYRGEYLAYEESMREECLKLYDEWAKHRATKYSDEIYLQMLKENRDVLDLSLEFYSQLGLIGSVVTVDERIEAFSLGYPINGKIFCVLFEITNLLIPGLAVYIFRKFCCDLKLNQFKFINVMDDFGVENIAKTKLSFQPALLFPSHVITKRSL